MFGFPQKTTVSENVKPVRLYLYINRIWDEDSISKRIKRYFDGFRSDFDGDFPKFRREREESKRRVKSRAATVE